MRVFTLNEAICMKGASFITQHPRMVCTSNIPLRLQEFLGHSHIWMSQVEQNWIVRFLSRYVNHVFFSVTPKCSIWCRLVIAFEPILKIKIQ